MANILWEMIVKMLTHIYMMVYTWWCWHIYKGGGVCKLGGIRRFRENGMPIFYCAGCKFLWLAHLSKGEENGGDASVGQVTGRWIQKHWTLTACVRSR